MLWMEYENTKYDHDPHFVVIVSIFAQRIARFV
jgi:hypothetical protein